jgi:dihydroneopterin aldolase
MIMGKIILEDMEFFAFHGCNKEEKLTGNNFIVNLEIVTNTSKAEKTDKIEDTINYQEIYRAVKQEMEVASNLLEHVANRTLNAVFRKFHGIQSGKIKISKINPPLGGKLRCVSVEIERNT